MRWLVESPASVRFCECWLVSSDCEYAAWDTLVVGEDELAVIPPEGLWQF